MRFFTVFLLIGMSGLSAFGQTNDKAVTVVNILPREHGYSNFKSMVVSSKSEFGKFMQSVQEQEHWNRKPEFLKAMESATFDFSKEILVLLRHEEGSGSNQVTFLPPMIKDGKVICKIARKVPPIGTDDLAYYCFAIRIPRKAANSVELWVERNGWQKSETISLK